MHQHQWEERGLSGYRHQHRHRHGRERSAALHCTAADRVSREDGDKKGEEGQRQRQHAHPQETETITRKVGRKNNRNNPGNLNRHRHKITTIMIIIIIHNGKVRYEKEDTTATGQCRKDSNHPSPNYSTFTVPRPRPHFNPFGPKIWMRIPIPMWIPSSSLPPRKNTP